LLTSRAANYTFPVLLLLLLQVKDKWDFRLTARYELYADFFNRYIQHDFKPQLVKDPSLQ
jgi:beta-ureidopropionase